MVQFYDTKGQGNVEVPDDQVVKVYYETGGTTKPRVTYAFAAIGAGGNKMHAFTSKSQWDAHPGEIMTKEQWKAYAADRTGR